MRTQSQGGAGGAESGQVGDDLSNVDGGSSNSGVEGCGRGRGGEGSNGGDGELHFDGVGLVVVVVWEKASDYINGLVAEASVKTEVEVG